MREDEAMERSGAYLLTPLKSRTAVCRFDGSSPLLPVLPALKIENSIIVALVGMGLCTFVGCAAPFILSLLNWRI